MRIVAGRHRGRRLAVPEGDALRPTADRVREALFNILMHAKGGDPLAGRRIVDAFAGTGALGLEALSRGAGHAVFIENDRRARRALRENINNLGEAARADVVTADAADPGPPPAGRACALALLDPPYHSGLAAAALAALAQAGWLETGAVAVVELAAREALVIPQGFAVFDERRYGAAKLVFLRFVAHGKRT